MRAKNTLNIDGTSNAAFNTSHVFTVLSSTEVQLDLEAGAAEGGFLSVDPERIVQFIVTDFTTNASQYQNPTRWVFDRCLFDGRGFPYRITSLFQLYGDDHAVIDSYIHRFNSWRPYNRVSNYFESGLDGASPASVLVFLLTLGARKKIHNNYVGDCAGICLFAEEGGGNPATLPTDVTVTRNTFYAPDTLIAGKPGDKGLIHYNRHRIEFKRGIRIRIEGNIFDGSWVDAVPTGPAILLSPRVTGNRISDVDISYNTFRRIGQAIQVEGQDNMLTWGTPATARVRIFNNLTYDHDFYTYRANPSFIGGAGPPGSLTGGFLLVQWPTEDIVVERNTVFDNRGSSPRFYSHNNGRRAGLVIRNNLFSSNNDNNHGAIPSAFFQQGYVPPVTGSIREAFDQTHRNSVISHNVVIPGVTISSTSASYQPPWPNNYSTAACEAFWAGFEHITCVPGSNVRERMAAVRWFDFAANNFRLQSESPFVSAASDGGSPGADIGELESRQGKVRNTRVIDITQTGASVHYTAPDSAPCYVDYSPEEFPRQGVLPERISDGGGEPTEATGVERPRAVELTGLSPGTLYYYRVQCQSEQPHGTFVTLQ